MGDAAYHRAWAKANPDRIKKHKETRRAKERSDPTFKRRRRDQWLRRKYGLSIDDYERMLLEQGGGCKICQYLPTDRQLHVDHCHKTGRIRALLCHICNWYVGKLERRPGSLQRLQEYLA